MFQRESQSYNNVKGFLVPIKNETMPNLNDEIIGKASQRDKVVNHYKFEIGTAKDDELLVKIKDIIKQSDDKAKDCNKKLGDIVKNTTTEVVEEINKAFDNPQKDPSVSSVKKAIGALRGLLTIKDNELANKQTELEACKELPLDDVSSDAKMLKLFLYLGLSSGLGYVSAKYVANDPELMVAFTPAINIIIYVLEQRIGALKALVGGSLLKKD